MSDRLKKGLDSECDGVLGKLLKKGCDANSFITEEVKNALVAFTMNSSE